VLDYSVLERIHYLLVAGFDVYGNLGHQLNTRLYMDFLRTEGEDYFLSFLPAKDRRVIRDSWYHGIRRGDKDISGAKAWMDMNFVIGYQSDQPQQELYHHLEKYLGSLAGKDSINRCDQPSCLATDRTTADKKTTDKVTIGQVNKVMQKAAKMHGLIMAVLPDLAFVRVEMGGRPEEDMAFSFISDKAYKSVSSMFEDEKILDRRDYVLDKQTVVPWLEGSYPNFFYSVKLESLDDFITTYSAITNRQQYEIFIARYGIRRTDERFWQLSDWFNAEYRREQPELAGVFDLNRYQNR